jgi:hypothetical protein
MQLNDILDSLIRVENTDSYEESKKILQDLEEKLNFYGLAKMYLDDYTFEYFSSYEIAEALYKYGTLSYTSDEDLINVIQFIREGDISELMKMIYMSFLSKCLLHPGFNKFVRDRTLSPSQVLEKSRVYPSIILGGNTE